MLFAWSLRCFIASAMYSLLSWTTIVEPLSALFIISVGLFVRWFRACHSFLVRLSDLLCLCSFIISGLTLSYAGKYLVLHCQSFWNVKILFSNLKWISFFGLLWFVVKLKIAFCA